MFVAMWGGVVLWWRSVCILVTYMVRGRSPRKVINEKSNSYFIICYLLKLYFSLFLFFSPSSRSISSLLTKHQPTTIKQNKQNKQNKNKTKTKQNKNNPHQTKQK
jgi:hypothetical protein